MVAFSVGLIGASIAPGYPDTRAAYDWLRSSANCPNVANSVSLRLSVTGRKGSIAAYYHGPSNQDNSQSPLLQASCSRAATRTCCQRALRYHRVRQMRPTE